MVGWGGVRARRWRASGLRGGEVRLPSVHFDGGGGEREGGRRCSRGGGGEVVVEGRRADM